MCLSLFILDVFILCIHYNQFISYLVQRLGLHCVLCFRCLPDNAYLTLTMFLPLICRMGFVANFMRFTAVQKF